MAEWHDGYAKALEHTHDTLDQLGAPREANGRKLYVHERIRSLRPHGCLGCQGTGVVGYDTCTDCLGTGLSPEDASGVSVSRDHTVSPPHPHEDKP